jgi:hypothetical protein
MAETGNGNEDRDSTLTQITPLQRRAEGSGLKHGPFSLSPVNVPRAILPKRVISIVANQETFITSYDTLKNRIELQKKLV